MKFIKNVFNVCVHNFRKWKTDYRIWTLGAILLLLTHNSMNELKSVSNFLNVSIPPWSFTFLYTQFYMKLIYTLPLLFIFCDAPFIDRDHLFVIIRTGRIKWFLGQVLYIIAASALYYLFLMACTLFFSYPNLTLTNEWGKLFYTISRTDAAMQMDVWSFNVPWNILNYFTPIQAMVFTLLMSWSSGCLLGMIVFTCNVLQSKRIIGVIVGGSIIILSAFLSNDYLSGSKWFSPLSWSTLNQIDIAGLTNCPPFQYCVTSIVIGFLICFFLSLFKIRRLEICTKGDGIQ